VTNECKINSYHHQGIKVLGDNLINAGESLNLIEAIEHDTLDIYAVQWHPEKLNDEFSKNIIRRFRDLLNNK
jgi:putative glutamine amidotransferase